jgi:mannitol/fructose-specific phosphotransferase system IIA component
LKEDNIKLRDTIKGKDDAIHALSLTLIEKGEHNKRLLEKMSEMKNHQLKHHFLNQPILT